VPLDHKALFLAGLTRSEPRPDGIKRARRGRICRHVPHGGTAELFQTEVGARGKLHQFHALLDKRDKRHE
jgi:hypothetical protein